MGRYLELARQSLRCRCESATAPEQDTSDAPAIRDAPPIAGGPAGAGHAPPHEIPDGWAVRSWIDRLRYLAGVCMNPTRADELAEWADGLECWADQIPLD